SNQSEGGAYVHNLMIGSVYTRSESNRFTPYFLPHSTMIAGLVLIPVENRPVFRKKLTRQFSQIYSYFST
ncbi:MAG: hypothetical protein ACTSYA_01130, partial [Candidatus Kariarchaeaceae archaeon]